MDTTETKNFIETAWDNMLLMKHNERSDSIDNRSTR